jgi:MFS family permease
VSDEPNPAISPPPTSRRRRRVRLRVYFETWLLSTFLVFSFTMVWHLSERASGRDGLGSKGAVFVVAPLLSLLSLPALWLLRIFRERSPSTWLRFVRRIVVGAVCGAFPAALLALMTAHSDGSEAQNAVTLWSFGIVFGIVAGLVDAMHLDVEQDDLAA